MKSKHIQHLYWRIGFGILPKELEKELKNDKRTIVYDFLKSSVTITPLTVDTTELSNLIGDSFENIKKNIKKFQSESRKKTIELNLAWIERLSNTTELLREKITLFWANHFVCEDNNIFHTQQFHNTLRKHALGNFKDFVIAISKEPAMIKYLNTKQNKKQKPNENFARELMELFTLGLGQYSEQDIKESARAFTGYSHNFKGEFVFRERQHDNGVKTFFGKTGNFNGDDIIEIILENKSCAKFICEKVYRYFVNDTIDEYHINEMVNVFYADYDIAALMKHIMLSDWFYDEKNIGAKIKSPIEYIVGMQRLVPIVFKDPKQLLYIQKVLGQILFKPPNVAGWKGGKSWIDSNTIVLRLKLPSLILNDAYISNASNGAKDFQMDAKKQIFRNRYGKRFKAEINWTYFNKSFGSVDINNLDKYILITGINDKAASYLESLSKVSKQEYCIQLMSLPEYQMC